MVTWMQHEKNGRHPATGVEIEQLKLEGWTVCEKKAKADDMPLIPQEPLPAPRRGRPKKG